jgi:protoporphyrinogen oxidase
MNMNGPDAAIGVLGGGLAGLAVAAQIPDATEVLEQGERPGGHLESVSEEGFTFDAGGPHIMFSRNTQTLDYMVSLLEGNAHVVRRNNKVLYKGRLVKYPFENGLGDLDPQDRFECLYHYLYNEHPAPTNFKEWMYHTFGTGLTEKYLLPYNEKIWKAPADQMSHDWVDGRVPKPPQADVIKAAVGLDTEGYTHQLNFYYPLTGGIESLAHALAKRIPKLVLGFTVRHIRKTARGWLVSDGKRERLYEHIVSTLPIIEMADIVEDVTEDVKECVRKLHYNSLMTITLGLTSNRLPDYTAIYVPDPELLFHRLSFPAVFSPNNAPKGCSLIQAEITGIPGDGVWELDDAEVLARVISGVESTGLLRRDEICYTKVLRSKYGYVVHDFGYRSLLDQAKSYFEGLGIALCGRNAEFEYMNMDQCIESAIRTVARVGQEPRRN